MVLKAAQLTSQNANLKLQQLMILLLQTRILLMRDFPSAAVGKSLYAEHSLLIHKYALE